MKSNNLYDNLKHFDFIIWTKNTPHGSVPYSITKDGKFYGTPEYNSDQSESLTLEELMEELNSEDENDELDTETEDDDFFEIVDQKPLNEKIFDGLDMVDENENPCPDSDFSIDIDAAFHILDDKIGELGTVRIWRRDLADAKQNTKKTFEHMIKHINAYIKYAKKKTVKEHQNEINDMKEESEEGGTPADIDAD